MPSSRLSRFLSAASAANVAAALQAEGGDAFTMLLEGRNIDMTGIVDLDALIDYLADLPQPTPIPGIGRFTPVPPAP